MNWIDTILEFSAKNRRTLQLVLGILLALFIIVTELPAQNVNSQGFIYGKVHTDENTYIGQIRWGKEEAFWNDLFNARKTSYRPNLGDDEEEGSWFDISDWSLSSIWSDKKSSTTHQFVVQFGDIATIKTTRDPKILYLQMRDGNEIKVNGSGANDTGATLRLLDPELGELSIKWSRINKVEFLPTPQNLSENLGVPLYGTVKTFRKGDFTGFIQWDNDERLGRDKLDGSTRDGSVSINFDQIKSIASRRDGSDVVMKSGRELYVYGTNDVNKGNRGIIVSIDGVGKIVVPWRSFESVDFQPQDNSGLPYSSYASPKKLRGTVYTYNDEEVSGVIIYDLDETWDYEMIEGNDDEIEYKIPMRNIKSIRPKNYAYSQVTLKNGEVLLLGKKRDITDSNDGLMVIKREGQKPEYIRWKDIAEISFE